MNVYFGKFTSGLYEIPLQTERALPRVMRRRVQIGKTTLLIFAVIIWGIIIRDGIANPYNVSPRTYQIQWQSTLPQAGSIAVELSRTIPQVTFKKWNGEVTLGLRYDAIEGNGRRKPFTNIVEWKGVGAALHAYPLVAKEGMEDGGFEVEVVLEGKPASNVFEFQLTNYNNFNFFYQPELTQVEISRGHTRPENVVGSYAVYHKAKKDHIVGQTNYATGKAFHIYRPKAIDANGVEQWAELSYKNGVLSVTVPESFLDSAAYPVRVDPTFGYTTAGGSTGGFNGVRTGVAASPTSSGTVDKISAYVGTWTAGRKMKAALYSGNTSAASLLSPQSAEVTSGTANAWNDFTFSGGPSVTSGSNYTMVGWGDAATLQSRYDAVGGTTYFEAATTYGAWPDPAGTGHGAGYQFSVYTTYSTASLTFTVATNQFPSLMPGFPVFATTTLSVNTNNTNGWNVTVSRDDSDTTMDLDTDAATNISDQTAWLPGAATTTAGNAVRFGSLLNSGDVLAFRVMTASGTTSFISTTWWGSVDSYVDNASTLWAGFPTTTQKIGDSSVSSGGSARLNTVLYYLDVSATQKTGTYSGGLTYTATMNP